MIVDLQPVTPAEAANMNRLIVAMLLTAVSAPAQIPDTILVDGDVLTADDQASRHEAVAVHDGRILAVGTTAEIRALAGQDTREIALGGRTVIPGLIDSHIHAIRAARTFATEVNWIGATSIVEAMARIRARAAVVDPDTWLIVAGGWSELQFEERRRPTQMELVDAAPNHPVYVQLGYGWALLTPRGLDMLGLAGPGDVPEGGRFDGGAISGPTSVIVGLFDRLPAPTDDQQVEGTRRFFREMNRLAVTGVIDPGGNNLAPGSDYHALFQVWREGDLTVRVAFSLGGQTPGEELAEFEAFTQMLPMGFGDDMLTFNGIGERVTAAMNNNDNPSDSDKERFYDVVRWAAGRGMSVTVHWPNDGSVDHLLDIFQQVADEVPIRDLRWSVAHLDDASGPTLERMRAMGVGWTVQLGRYYGGQSVPGLVDALAIGTPVGMGTDAHRVATYNPFTAIEWILSGVTIGGRVPEATELPSREQALRVYSRGSAWFAHAEDRRGSIEAGKLADLAVLSEDYMAVPTDRIGDIESVLTMVGGRVVYASGEFSALED
jgi:hypothetical protein